MRSSTEGILHKNDNNSSVASVVSGIKEPLKLGFNSAKNTIYLQKPSELIFEISRAAQDHCIFHKTAAAFICNFFLKHAR